MIPTWPQATCAVIWTAIKWLFLCIPYLFKPFPNISTEGWHHTLSIYFQYSVQKRNALINNPPTHTPSHRLLSIWKSLQRQSLNPAGCIGFIKLPNHTHVWFSTTLSLFQRRHYGHVVLCLIFTGTDSETSTTGLNHTFILLSLEQFDKAGCLNVE